MTATASTVTDVKMNATVTPAAKLPVMQNGSASNGHSETEHEHHHQQSKLYSNSVVAKIWKTATEHLKQEVSST